jgi:hypothetical protein
MTPTFEGPSQQGVAPASGEPVTWEVKRVRFEGEARQAIAGALAAMRRLGYSDVAQERVGRALTYAMLSALRCSRQGNGAGRATLYYQVGEEYLLAEVEGRIQEGGKSPLQGPHGPALLQSAEGDAFWMRSYTWLRCRRWDDHFSLCGYLSVP